MLVLALLGAAPKSPPPISVVLNGAHLTMTPAPRFVSGHLMVPVRTFIEALGFAFAFDGKNVVTAVGSKTVTLRAGSGSAYKRHRESAHS